ncbi:glycosyltransferase family 8 protein, partial [Pasteurella multocida]
KEERKENIRAVIELSGCSVCFIHINKDEFSDFPKTISYISLATYARLKAADYLLKNLRKVLYLDVDILVLGNIGDLWETNIEDYALAACIDSFVENKSPSHKEKISLSCDDYYFNAGIMLINLEEWRKINVFVYSLNWLSLYGKEAIYQDQDILNSIFKGNIYYLDCRFNFMPEQMDRIKQYHKGKLRELHALEKTTMPVVISHYCGPEKAWHSDCKHFQAYSYYKILAEITRSMDREKQLSLKTYLQNLIRKIKYRFKYKIY